MANVIDIVVRAKDATAGTWKKVSARAKKLGRSIKKSMAGVGKFAKGAAVAVLAIGAAMLKAAQRAEEFNKQVGQIATIADVSIGEVKRQVRSMSAEFGLAKDELTKGLYDALSAGVPKHNAFSFLETAAKGAIAGASTTAEAVDILTTTINAFGLDATEAERVSDALFTTVRIGKTTLSELAQSFAQVGPLASASGVAFEEVLAATATLTKAGTPTAQAMTQIRAAIIAMNDKLGDGWSATMTLQEGMIAMRDAAGGSTSKLKELTGRVEGTLGILGLTGKKAKGAAEDLEELGNAAGATNEAFGKMDKVTVLAKVMQAIDNVFLKLGDETFKMFGTRLTGLAKKIQAFSESDHIQLWAENAKAAFKWLLPMIKDVGTALDLIIGKVKIATMRTAAFLGSMAGSGKMPTSKEAIEGIYNPAQAFRNIQKIGEAAGEASVGNSDVVENAEKDKADRLAAIRAEKDATKDAEEKEQKRAEAAAEEDKRKLDALEALEQGIKDKAAAEDKAAKDLLAAADKQTIQDELEEKRINKRAKLAQEIVKSEKELADLKKPVPGAALEKAAGAEGRTIVGLQRQLSEVAENRAERRAAKLEQRDKDRDISREKELRARVERGTVLGKDNAAFLKKKDLQLEIDERNAHKALLLFDAEKEREKEAKAQMDRLVIAAELEVTLLKQNLKNI